MRKIRLFVAIIILVSVIPEAYTVGIYTRSSFGKNVSLSLFDPSLLGVFYNPSSIDVDSVGISIGTDLFMEQLYIDKLVGIIPIGKFSIIPFISLLDIPAMTFIDENFYTTLGSYSELSTGLALVYKPNNTISLNTRLLYNPKIIGDIFLWDYSQAVGLYLRLSFLPSSLSSYFQLTYTSYRQTYIDTAIGVKVYPLGVVLEDLFSILLAVRYNNAENTYPSLSISLYSSPLRFLSLWVGLDKDRLTTGLGIVYKDTKININGDFQDPAMVLSFSLNFSIHSLKSIFGGGTPPDVIEFEKGLKAFNERNYKDAEIHFRKALIINPEHELARLYLEKVIALRQAEIALSKEQQQQLETLKKEAEEYEEKGQFGKAILSYKAIADMDPENREAIEKLEKIRQTIKEKVEGLYKEALDYYAGNDLQKALQKLSEALDLDPLYTPARNLYEKIKKEQEIKLARELEKKEREQLSIAYYKRGLKSLSELKFDDAIDSFKTALEINPENVDAKNALENAIKQQKEFQKQEINREKAIALYRQALSEKETKNYIRAIDLLKQAIRYDPQNEEIYNTYTNTVQEFETIENGKYEEAIKLFEAGKYAESLSILEKIEKEAVGLEIAETARKKRIEIQTLLKEEVQHLLTISQKLYENKEYNKVIENMKTVLAIEPENKKAKELLQKALKEYEVVINRMFAEGKEEFNKGNYEKAIDIFERMLSILPQDHQYYATVNSYIDKAKKTIKEQGEYIEINKKLSLAKAYYENFNFDKAEEIVKEVLTKDPKNKEANELLAKINEEKELWNLRKQTSELFVKGLKYYRQEKFDEAIRYLEQAKTLAQKINMDVSLITTYIENAKKQKELSANKYYLDAKKSLEKGDLKSARENILKAMEINPNTAEVKALYTEIKKAIAVKVQELSTEAKKLFIAGNYDKSIEIYKQAVDINPENEALQIALEDAINAKNLYEKAQSSFYQKDYTTTIEYLSELLTLNPSDQKAIDLLNEARLQGAMLKQAWLQEAKEALEKGDLKKALIRLKTVVQVDPNNTEAVKLLKNTEVRITTSINENLKKGIEAYEQKRYAESISYLRKVIELDPKNTKAREYLMIAEKAYAEERQKKEMETQKTVTAYLFKGVELYRAGKLEEAIQQWEKVLELDPNNDQARKYIARAKLKIGK